VSHLCQAERESRPELYLLFSDAVKKEQTQRAACVCDLFSGRDSLDESGEGVVRGGGNAQRKTARADGLEQTAGGGGAENETTAAAILLHGATKSVLSSLGKRVHFQQHNNLRQKRRSIKKESTATYHH
jgi:hypothetical protein